MEKTRQYFQQFLSTAFDNGQYATDDVIAFVLPLFEEVLSFHEASLVAPFENPQSLFITDHHADIDETLAHTPRENRTAIATLLAEFKTRSFDITGKSKLETDVTDGFTKVDDMLVHLNPNTPLRNAAYIKGYSCFEIQSGHHDALTDIFCLGLVLGSMALSLDLYDDDDLKSFAQCRNNPVQYNIRIHPTVSTLITEMTELDRDKRIPDLYDIIHRLKFYRDYDPEKQTDLSSVAGWIHKIPEERSQFILNKLRNRLFDTSRRNRLLYYKSNMRFVNLTVSSVPMVLHYQSIRPELLFTWNSDISAKVKGMKEIVLNKYLRFEDHTYLSSSLDKIRVESQRDVHEFGFSQLKLVIAFLNWHNLKEVAHERIQSPLLLIPVEIKKTKRLKEDHHSITPLDNAAEVNPVLANQLRELYGIRLPDFVDLDEMSLEQFYQLLKAQIDAANQGIRLLYADKPKIKLVYSVAKQTVSNYKRRLRNAGNVLGSYKNIAYSYLPENYKPLGLELYRQRVEPRHAFLEFLVNEDIKLSTMQLTGASEKERELYELAESESNPYSWDFDICNIVLGNFNYKKMSLVRDYTQVSDKKIQHRVFDSLFSNQPKQISTRETSVNNPEEWYHVITADPTQASAVLKSRTGESYIIQGPPGTGKSQTITNLIADYAARGKSVLFVCEKRAALDVVYHRLKQNKLDDLCCYIHDSQGDKREFIKNLKTTYEDFSKNRMDVAAIEDTRTNLMNELNEQLRLLKKFHDLHISTTGNNGVTVRQLIERLIAIKSYVLPLSQKEQELVPGYDQWNNAGGIIQQLSTALEESGADAAFAEHPLSKLNDQLFVTEQPLHQTDTLVQQSQQLLQDIEATLQECPIDPIHCEYPEQVKNLVQDAVLLQQLAEHQNLRLVDPANKEAKELNKKMGQLKEAERKQEQLLQQNQYWQQKFSAADTDAALAIAEKQEGSFFKFLNGAWRKLKKQMQESYDFSKHAVKPSITSVLQQLKAAYAASTLVSETKSALEREYQVDNITLTYMTIETLRNKKGDKEIDYLLAHPDADNVVLKLARLQNKLHQLEVILQQCLSHYSGTAYTVIKDTLDNISMNTGDMTDLLPSLRQFSKLPEPVKTFIRTVPVTPVQAEAVMADQTLKRIFRENKSFEGMDLTAVEQASERIRHCYTRLLKLNAAHIKGNVWQQFVKHLEISNTAISQLNTEQRQFKKNYNEGRKILENEFGKSMRYKSIREICTRESGLVLKDIKPIWLMSPLSVSDSLPLDTAFFDVVIFDEASQITLEEGIPALFRSTQTIIVGDDKQMPPTNFFNARAEDPDDLEQFNEENADEMLSTDADSLLAQGARKLDSTMLSWHYRSHYETLISYSNHAFYEAALLTIPDKTIHHTSKKEIEVQTSGDAATFADCLFDRSISYHFLPHSVYEKRSNQDEAAYIASLIAELLKRKVKESIGIVAFSQEQQHTIEDALTSLAQTDKVFELLLEEAYNRTEDDQFTGLIIKNLENIQGDERDIIIMSVCYGFDARKKMIMNFGPVNKKGGEKRLNVIFSRAKKHMAIISSVHHFNITNDYNEGANYFKRFLQYAENISTGNMQTARTILDSLAVNKKETDKNKVSSIVLKDIRKQLEQKGYEVAEQVGQSGFKCSLAIKAKPEDEVYTMSILLDDEQHYQNPNLVEQYYQRPAILQSFGWRNLNIFAKDWLQQPEKVMALILKRLTEVPTPDTDTEDDISTEGYTTPVVAETGNISAEGTSTATAGTELPGFEDVVFSRLTFSGGGSHKFWEAGVKENKLLVRFGKIGTRGQVQVKTFDTPEKAEKEKQKLINEKKNKGYQSTDN
ncbi:MAG: AAA domain-containing protein [Bacteroidetes bacterium]|nr:AAA domain-containing protein [Bacteroidota bacterium]